VASLSSVRRRRYEEHLPRVSTAGVAA